MQKIIVKPEESIQEAIDKAPAGAVISLERGVWQENLVIKKNLTLKGKRPEMTIIKGKKQGSPVIIIASDSEIEVILVDLTIAKARRGVKANPEEDGIRGMGMAKITIQWCNIRHNFRGIVLLNFVYAVIENSRITSNRSDGVVLFDNSEATITESEIAHNPYDGICLAGYSVKATILRNTILKNGFDGVVLVGSGARVRIEENKISQNRIGVSLKQGRQLFSGSVIGKNNFIPGPAAEGGGNKEGTVWPEELSFLTTEEGGQWGCKD